MLILTDSVSASISSLSKPVIRVSVSISQNLSSWSKAPVTIKVSSLLTSNPQISLRWPISVSIQCWVVKSHNLSKVSFETEIKWLAPFKFKNFKPVIWSLWPFKRYKPCSEITSQTIKSVSLEPEAKYEPVLLKANAVTADLWPLNVIINEFVEYLQIRIDPSE